MTDRPDDFVEFDELVAVALATVVEGPEPPPYVKARLMAHIAESAPAPDGFRCGSAATRTGSRMPCPASA